MKKVESRKSKVERGRLNWWVLLLLTFNLQPSTLFCQQPTSTAPLFQVNSQYLQGRTWADYKLSAGSGLTLNVAAGTALCGNPPAAITYAGGTLTMTNTATNYVYLDPAASCIPASNTTGFSAGKIPLGTVTAAGGAITGVSDVRTWLTDPYSFNVSGIRFANQFATLQAAVDDLPATGGTVFIPAGTYGSVILPDNPKIVNLIGAGIDVTILQPSAANTPAIQCAGGGLECGEDYVANLSVKAHASGSTGSAIDLPGFRSAVFDNIGYLNNAGANFASFFHLASCKVWSGTCSVSGHCYGNVIRHPVARSQTGPATIILFDNAGSASSSYQANANRIEDVWFYALTGIATAIDARRSSGTAIVGGLIEDVGYGEAGAKGIIPGTVTTIESIHFELVGETPSTSTIVPQIGADGSSNVVTLANNYISGGAMIDLAGVYGWTVYGNHPPLSILNGSQLSYNYGGTIYGTPTVASRGAFSFNMPGGLALVSVGAGGSGYSVNDVLTVADGTGGTLTVTSVASGAVTGVTITTAGTGYSPSANYNTPGPRATSVAPPGGTGCTINILTTTIPDQAHLGDRAGSGRFEIVGPTGGGAIIDTDYVHTLMHWHDDGLFDFAGQIQSSLATGTAPFIVASTTPVANLSLSGGAGSSVSVASLRLPGATTLPGTCVANVEVYVDTDATPAGQQVYLCNAAGTGWNLIGDGGAGGSSHAILSATHTDTTAAAVVRGDLMVGIGATPKWERYAKGTQYLPLTMGADEPGWMALALDQSAATSGILGSAKGGTGNGFTKFTGPTTAEKTFTLPDASAILVTTDTAATLTNKTLDVEGTGNVLTTVQFASFECVAKNGTASCADDTYTSGAPAEAVIPGTYTKARAVLDFDADTEEETFGSVWLPSDWTATGGVDIDVEWQAAAITGNVVWAIQTICVADAEAFDPAWNTASTVIDAAKGTTNQRNIAPITGITVTGCAANERMFWRFYRDADDAVNDTMAGDGRRIALRFKTRRAQ
jgi:hypothetical protein